MRVYRYCQYLAAVPFVIFLSLSADAANNSQNVSAEPSAALLQKVAKIDACAMALGQVNESVSNALQIRAEILMYPYYTDELDAMDDEQYNQIAWVKTYNSYYLQQQNQFYLHDGPEFAKDAAQQQYQAACVKLANEELKATTP